MIRELIDGIHVCLLADYSNDSGKRLVTVLISYSSAKSNSNVILQFGFGRYIGSSDLGYSYEMDDRPSHVVLNESTVLLLQNVEIDCGVTHIVVGPVSANGMGNGIKLESPHYLLPLNRTSLEKCMELTIAGIFDLSRFINPVYSLRLAPSEFIQSLTELFSSPTIPDNPKLNRTELYRIQLLLVNNSIKMLAKAGTVYSIRSTLQNALIDDINGKKVLILEWWQIEEYFTVHNINPYNYPDYNEWTKPHSIIIGVDPSIFQDILPLNPQDYIHNIIGHLVPLSMRYNLINLGDRNAAILSEVDLYWSS